MTVGITELPPEGMQLPGVALAGDPERGTKTTEGISLLFTTAGVTVQGPQPQIERLLVWSALDSATCREKVQLPDGREAAIMELTSGGQSIRFLLPSDAVSPGQAAYLDQALPTWLLRYKGAAAPTPPAPSPVAPGAQDAAGPEIGVELPPPGPAAPVTAAAETAPAPQVEVAAPAYATAAAAGLGAAGLTADPMSGNGNTPGESLLNQQPPSSQSSPMMQAPPLAAPPAPAPPAPVTPTLQAPPPPPPSPAPAAPAMFAPPPPPPPPVAAAPSVAAPTEWDDPPLGLTGPADIAPPARVKKPRFALTRKQLHEAEAASAAAAAAAPAATAPSPIATPPTADAAPKPAKKPRFALTRKQLREAEAAAAATAAGAAVVEATDAPGAAAPAPSPIATPPTADAAPKPAKKPRFALTRKQLREAEAAAAATAAGAAVVATPVVAAPAPSAPTAAPHPTASVAAPPTAPPVSPVPLAVQPPPPVAEWADTPSAQPTPTGGGTATADGTSGSSGADGVVLAPSGPTSGRRGLIALVAVLVLVVAGAGYLLTKKSPSPVTVTAPVANPTTSGAADTVLAGSINLRLTDLPAGWTATQPAQAVVRPPVAPAVAQATATNAMASCLDTSYAVVSGLFASGSLPGQTSLVQSAVFQSAAGSSFEMGSRTTVLSSPGQVQALEGVFTNPKFDLCFQQFHQSLATAAVAGAAVVVQPVTLSSPKGVTTFGVVSTYTVPGSGTQVVGDAYLLGGRIVTIIQPTTDGAAIPSNVFAPAYDAVAARVSASATR